MHRYKYHVFYMCEHCISEHAVIKIRVTHDYQYNVFEMWSNWSSEKLDVQNVRHAELQICCFRSVVELILWRIDFQNMSHA